MNFKQEVSINEIIKSIPDIISFIGRVNNTIINSAMPIKNATEGSITWLRAGSSNKYELLNNTKASIIIVEEDLNEEKLINLSSKSFLKTSNSKLSMIKIIDRFINDEKSYIKDYNLETDLLIGSNSEINADKIGKNVIIGSNVVIHRNVTIGDNVIIHSNVVIGEPGFNYDTDIKGTHTPFPHLGGVVIGNDCEIGSNAFISSGVYDPTTIASGTKIAQFVYIGATVNIGNNCQIRCRATLLGSVKVGNNVIIAPSSTIRDHLSIGNNSFIGIGSLILKNVEENQTWYGSPAKLVK